MSTLVIVNPAAGGGRAGRHAEAVLSRLPGELDIRRTVGPGHATALVAAARERGVSEFIGLGGDGTLFEIVNGALGAGSTVPRVALVPLGTGNSFGRDLGIHSVEQAIEAIAGGGRRPVDVVRIESDSQPLYSINIVGLGFSAFAGDRMNRRFKRLGVAGYLAAVAVEIAKLHAPRMRYRVDGGAWVDEFLLMLSLCNSQYTGGAMHMAPAACIDDGLLDLIALRPMTRARFASAFPHIFRGTHPELPEVEVGRARRVEFELSGPVEVLIDGEIRSLALSAVEVVPAALEVPCPKR